MKARLPNDVAKRAVHKTTTGIIATFLNAFEAQSEFEDFEEYCRYVIELDFEEFSKLKIGK